MYAHAVIFNHSNDPATEIRFQQQQVFSQQFLQMLRAGILESNEDHRGRAASCKSQQVPEAEIHCQNGALFGAGFEDDLIIGQSLQPFVVQVNGVMSLLTQPCSGMHRHRHVDQKLHERLVAADQALVGQSGDVTEGFVDVGGGEIGVMLSNGFHGQTRGNQFHNRRDRDAHPADACLTTHDMRIERNVIFHDTARIADSHHAVKDAEETLTVYEEAMRS